MTLSVAERQISKYGILKEVNGKGQIEYNKMCSMKV